MITDQEIQKIFDWADANNLSGKRVAKTKYDWGIDVKDEVFEENWFSNIRNGIPRNKELLKKITHLNLESNTLKDIPKEFGKLINLQHINFDKNNIETLLNDFFNLSNLQTLSLSNNNLFELSSNIQNLSFLKKLYLDRNPLKTIPNEIINLLKLQTLDLSSCEQLETLPKEIGKLENLENLHLDFCIKLIELPASIGELINLKTLPLEYCEGIKFLPMELGLLKNLEELDLKNCQSLTELPIEIGNLISLQSVDLQGCSELKNIPISIGLLSSLKKLNIHGCQMLKELPLEMKNLYSLKYLNFSFCDFKKMPKVIGDIESLTHLDITSNYSLIEIPNNFSNLTKLNILEIDIDEDDAESQKLKKQIIDITGMNFFEFGYNTTVFLRTCKDKNLKEETLNIKSFFAHSKKGNINNTIPKNLLLKGVPGTGKSRAIENIIKYKLELKDHKENILRINIHSASSNADLMQGIGISSKDGQIEYKEKQGLILNLIEKATYHPKQPFVLILEEIQENSLNELIGDLIYLIEEDKRAKGMVADDGEYEYRELVEKIIEENPNTDYVEIPYLVNESTEYRKMIMPDNLYIFCTSNYRDDKKVIEDNLLRRFEVLEIYPKESVVHEYCQGFFRELNENILKILEDEIHPDRFLIGHSNWLNVDNDEKFYRTFLKVVVEFKDVKEIEFGEFKKIVEELSLVEELSFGSYKSLIEDLQSKAGYDFLD